MSRNLAPPRGFTLVELVAVIVVLAIMAGLALPAYFDHASAARHSADLASLGAIRTALDTAHIEHRSTNASSASWITSINQIESVMQTGELPEGITIVAGKLRDQRGNEYTFTAETANQPARLTLSAAAGGGGGGGGGWFGS